MTSGENTANILLQRLIREVTKLWSGQPSEIKTAWDAYELCYAIGELTIGAASRAAESHADDEIKLTREDVENAEEIDITGAEERPLTDEEMLDRFARMFPSSLEAIVWNIKCARMTREKCDDNDYGKSV